MVHGYRQGGHMYLHDKTSEQVPQARLEEQGDQLGSSVLCGREIRDSSGAELGFEWFTLGFHDLLLFR